MSIDPGKLEFWPQGLPFNIVKGKLRRFWSNGVCVLEYVKIDGTVKHYKLTEFQEKIFTEQTKWEIKL